jgi:hypothetical protein
LLYGEILTNVLSRLRMIDPSWKGDYAAVDKRASQAMEDMGALSKKYSCIKIVEALGDDGKRASADVRDFDLAFDDEKAADDSPQVKIFDHVVANPPFSAESWGRGMRASQHGHVEYGALPRVHRPHVWRRRD